MRAPSDSALHTVESACREPFGFWLDSALVGQPYAQQSYAGCEPFAVLRSWRDRTEVWTPGSTHTHHGDPFHVLREMLREEHGRPGCAVGYLAYELKRFIEQVAESAVDDLGLPEMYICFYRDVQRLDPAALAPHDTAPAVQIPDPPASNFTHAEYLTAIEGALGYIVAGDIYQVNLSQRFRAPAPENPFRAYLALRSRSPAPFAAYLNLPEGQVLSNSPEQFLRFDRMTRRVATRPIKGTRPRGVTPAEDRCLAAELLASEKDRAENVMIVDLERNDLGRVAEIGSVAVTGLWELESYANVHHLTSTVVARLRDGLNAVDLLRATFPGGSITGAPKVRAMEIIDELEPTVRSVYTGAIGRFGFDGSLDLNVAIRTILVTGGQAYFQAGGGIVADSDPESEYEETLHKAASMASVLAAEPLRSGAR